MKSLSVLVASILIVILAVCASQTRQIPQDKGTTIPPMRAIGAIHPRLSGDGKNIAFSYQGAIWVCPRTGGGMTRLTDGLGFDTDPAWSPDGRKIACVRSGSLVLIESDTGKDLSLPDKIRVQGPHFFNRLEFHPDGRRLLGSFTVGGQKMGLAWLDLETGKANSLATIGFWGRFALSQDGQWVLYTESMNKQGEQAGNDGAHVDMWKISAEGGQPEKIASFPSKIHNLCWTPDGAVIVVTELGGAYYDLWRVPLANPLAGMEKLTFGQADEESPSVSSDGRWLAYSNNQDGATAIVVRNLRGGAEHTLTFDRQDFRKPTGMLRLATRDFGSKKTVCARVSLQQDNGKYHAPAGALYRVLANYGHFYCDRNAELILPAGKYHLRVFRGPEYKVHMQDVDIGAGETVDLGVDLTRWTHQARSGWYSGENHIHANYGCGEWYNTPRTMLQQCSGEDLNVCNFVVANSDCDAVFDRAFFRGAPDPLSTPETILYWNQEFRSTFWGHMTLVNLKQIVEPVFTGFKGTTNPWDVPTNADVGERTHWQKGHVNYTHVAQVPDKPFTNPYAGKGLPVDVALGKVDSMDINAAYFGSVPIWHRLLNCGFKLPASAGTDVFLNKINSRLPGGDRVYVHIDGPLTYAGWIEGLKAGKTFVTNGPMLELTLDRQGIGSSHQLKSAGKLPIHAKAISPWPMDKVELLYNGKVHTELPLTGDSLTATFETPVLIDKSGWLALRVSGKGHADGPLPLLNAHTSPIYVEVAGGPTRSRADALHFLAWIDELSILVRARDRVPNEALRRHIQGQLQEARTIYTRLAKE